MQPQDASGGHFFNIGADQFFNGLFPHPDTDAFPDILVPNLLVKNGASWDVLETYQPLWKDLQQDLGAEFLAQDIVNKFNVKLGDYTGTSMTFNDEIIAIFNFRIAISGNKLVIKPKQ